MADPANVSRRFFIQRAAVVLAAGPALLAACGGSAAPASSAPSSAAGGASGAAKPSGVASLGATSAGASGAPTTAGSGETWQGVKLPTTIAFKGPQPDLPGNSTGLDPGYYKFPKDTLVQSVPKPPGDGSQVSAFTYLTLAPPPPMDQNAAWQNVNKLTGATISMTQVSAADYPAKIGTLLAGNDYPDFIYNLTTVNPQGSIPALGQFVKGRCSDLTPYLSGDAIKDYPNLANYTSYTWRSSVVEGKMYAIPVQRQPNGNVIMYRKDLFDAAGVSMTNAPKNIDDFNQMLKALAQPKNNQWGIAGGAATYFALGPVSPLLAMFNAPNNWKLDSSGKLTKDFETPEYKQALGWAQDTWKAGYWHPNTPVGGNGVGNNDFMGGRFAVLPGVWGQYVQLWDIQPTIDPKGLIYPMWPFMADGTTKPVYLAGTGNFGLVHIKQQPNEARLKMLLGIANYFAAPFGTTEWLANYYGVEGTDFKYDQSGAPQPTDQGRKELTAVWRYIASPAYAEFDPYMSKVFADNNHTAQQAMEANMVFDPTLGLYSDTAFTAALPAQTDLLSAVTDIVVGRRP
ncbi:MAG TPA: hypothetical protein VFS62_14370, partial [Chloroflexota bacterium]|nr:hypothetical protein [Chloroflexota bacterium]